MQLGSGEIKLDRQFEVNHGAIGRLNDQVQFAIGVRAVTQGQIVGQDAGVGSKAEQGMPEAFVIIAQTTVR